MFERLIEASDGMRQCRPSLIPALCGCPDCHSVQMIATPVLGSCPHCGKALVVLGAEALVQPLNSGGKFPSPDRIQT
jgi:hypothetical protein